mgnify:CR=1 FL=1
MDYEANPNDYVFDLETYPNCFSAVFVNDYLKKVWVFEISSRKNDSKRLRVFLKKLYQDKARMVGFNNLGFDYPIIHWWLQNRGKSVEDIYEYAMGIIDEMKGGFTGFSRFAVPEYKHFVQQIDLFKIQHYDNKNKSTSLKMLEFNMRSKNIEDLPFPVGTVLTDSEIDVLIKYNRHDVMETLKFYKECADAISLRETLIIKYDMNCMNYNDTRLGKAYFIKMLEEVDPESCYSKVNGKRKMNQTKRDSIDLSQVIFPYIEFERPEFNAVLDWIKRQDITETKGVFSDIEEHDLGPNLTQYCNMKQKKKKLQGEPTKEELKELMRIRPCSWVDRVELKSKKISYNWTWRVAETLNVVVDGLEYVFGLGGLHASVSGVTFTSDDNYKILDYDYASFYPNIFISNRVYPEHLGEGFCDIYKDVYLQRKGFDKGTPENAVMKLALNGVYGCTNDKFSPFYDPKATMTVTINGQLTLCALAEKLIKVGGLQVIQCNTDGLTVYCPKVSEEVVDKIVSDWDKVIKLEMEKAVYSKMAISNVNNYIAVYDNGKVKRNGAYEFEGLQWHQNQSALIIKKAAFEKIVNGVPIMQTLKSCKDPFDFMLRTKVPRSSRLISVDEEGLSYPEQNITRYYICKDGMKLVKVMPPLEGKEEERFIGIDKTWLVKTCNDISKFDWGVDYDYYEAEAIKLVEGVGDIQL